MTEIDLSDTDVERMVVATMIDEPHMIDVAYEIIGDDLNNFTSGIPRLLYETTIKVWSSQEKVDVSTIWSAMSETDRGRVGGMDDYWDYVKSYAFGDENMEYYCNILKHHTLLRKFYVTAYSQLNRIEEDFLSKEFNTDKLVSTMEDLIFDISDDHAGTTLPVNSNDVLAEIEEAIVKKLNDELPPPITSGFTDFDEIIWGFRPTHTYIISGTPGAGKSALAHNIAIKLLEQEVPVVYISYEMDKSLVLSRMISTSSGIPIRQIVPEEKISNEHWSIFQECRAKFSDTSLIIIDDHPSLEQVAYISKRMKKKFGTFIIIADYIQLMVIANQPGQTEYQRVSDLSGGIKMIAQRDKVPIIVISQLSREGKLRGSGYLDQDASVISKLAQNDPDTALSEYKNITQTIIKNRMGPVGEVQLRFHGPTLKFEGVQ